MAKVRVFEAVSVKPTETSTIVFPAGYEGPAPDAVIDLIVAAGKGERVTKRGALAEGGVGDADSAGA